MSILAKMLKRVRWRWILPLMQVVLAGVLLYWGMMQYRAKVGHGPTVTLDMENSTVSWDVPAVWDYIPPAHILLMCVNLPALVLASPLPAIAPENHLLHRTVLLIVVFLFWRWIGSRLDQRTGNLPQRVGLPSRVRVGAWILGIVAAAAFAVFGAWSLVHPGGLALVLPASVVAWALFFVWYLSRKLQKHWQSRRQESAVR